MNKKDIIRVTLLISALLLFCGGCKKTPAQEAEKAFTKAFEKAFPEWEVTKIILSPCKGANMYRGRFDCKATAPTDRCCMTMQKPSKDMDDAMSILMNDTRVPCDRRHGKGETITWSVLVTYAHGDCYYSLAQHALDYD